MRARYRRGQPKAPAKPVLSSTPWRSRCEWPVDIDGRTKPYHRYGLNMTAAWDSVTREWPTREQAIRSAKAMLRTHGNEAEIYYGGSEDSPPVAYVRSDALGRVWVDVMSMDAGRLI